VNFHAYDGPECEPARNRVDPGGVSGDDATLLQAMQSRPGSRYAEVNLGCQLGERRPSISLHGNEQATIHLIDGFSDVGRGHRHSLPQILWSRASNTATSSCSPPHTNRNVESMADTSLRDSQPINSPAPDSPVGDVASSIEFVYVDVFASVPLTGAPLTLVTDADKLSDAQMRSIAREFNQSETTFIQNPTAPGATRRLRSFTPTGEEVLGAGHNALGAWLWLASSGQLTFDEDTTTFTQQIGTSVLPVHIQRTPGRPVLVTMEQAAPVFGAVAGDRASLASALGLEEGDLVPDRPALVVSTGAGHLLVPIRTRSAIDRANPDAAGLTAALRGVGGEGCYLYTHDTIDAAATVYTRFFNPAMGIWEDPATGTAAGPLAALLVRDRIVPVLDEETTVTIEQGQSMGRPSTITVTVSDQRVRVSGSGLVIAHGTLTLTGIPR
jgi:trans-2,3-dihydro-3-hydroxyanthranilate isomerase